MLKELRQADLGRRQCDWSEMVCVVVAMTTNGIKQVPPPEGPVPDRRNVVWVRSTACRRSAREEERPGAPGAASATPARQGMEQRPRTPSNAVLRPLRKLSARCRQFHQSIRLVFARSSPAAEDRAILRASYRERSQALDHRKPPPRIVPVEQAGYNLPAPRQIGH
jgi:hypothetical protein